VLILAILGVLTWADLGQSAAYNGSWLDTAGEAFAVGMAFIGIVLLLLLRPEGWGIGVGMLGLLFAGHLGYLLLPAPAGDFSGLVRLSQMAAYPLLFALTQRITSAVSAAADPAGVPLETIDIQSSGFDQSILLNFSDLYSARTSEAAYSAAAQLTAHFMAADVCLFVELPDSRDQMLALGGCNLTKKQSLPPFSISTPLGYTVGNALRRGRPLRLPASSTSGDELGVGHLLKVSRLGHLLAAPLPRSGEEPVRGIILLAPYSSRGWSSVDQDNLTILADQIVRILRQRELVETAVRQAEEAEQTIDGLRQQLEPLERDKENLSTRLAEFRQLATQEQHRAESLAALVSSSDTSADVIDRLQREIQDMRAAVSSDLPNSHAHIEQLEAELHLALEEIAYLKTTISDLDLKMIEQQFSAPGQPGLGELQEVAAAIAQDLRQPLSSIVDYTDSLLGETLGLLNSGQRKSLERIKAANERMKGLLEDLARAAEEVNAAADTPRSSANLNAVVDEAISLSVGQIRDKNILLRVDIPEEIPPAAAEHEVLHQIVLHLIQNACAASPIEGEISLQAGLHEDENGRNSILLKISDQGDEIPLEDLPRIFSRLYRPGGAAGAPEGRPGVSLSFVKSQVESQGGKIWVETEHPKGSTFSVLLPVVIKSSLEKNNGSLPG
jgi:signal transduction histidine kinase